jgi:hypothetical protein
MEGSRESEKAAIPHSARREGCCEFMPYVCLGTDTLYRLNLCVLWRWDPWLGRMGPSLKVDDF